ncbi:hypothetical protein FLA_3339 [Filimonas lacunae]|nr:hypothetical protein FLA_3339 [Filimonas lacunae]
MVRVMEDSVMVSDKQTGKAFTVHRKSYRESDTCSFLVLDYGTETFLSDEYPGTAENDRLVKKLSEQIRYINTISNEEEQFRACKEWIFATMKAPFIQWNGFYEWLHNGIIWGYAMKHAQLFKKRPDDRLDILTAKEKSRLYKDLLTYRWPGYYTWDIVNMLDTSYDNRLIGYVMEELKGMLTVDHRNLMDDGGVYRLLNRDIGGKAFLTIAFDYTSNGHSYDISTRQRYLKEMVDALELYLAHP